MRGDMHEHRPEREAVGCPAEGDINLRAEPALASPRGARCQIRSRPFQQRPELRRRAPGSVLDRRPQRAWWSIDAISPPQHRTHDMGQRVVQRSRADVKTPVPLLFAQAVARTQHLACPPRVMTQQQVERVRGSRGRHGTLLDQRHQQPVVPFGPDGLNTGGMQPGMARDEVHHRPNAINIRVTGAGFDDAAPADSIVDDDDGPGAGQGDRAFEVLRATLLVRVDEDQVKRRYARGDQRVERLCRRTRHHLDPR